MFNNTITVLASMAMLSLMGLSPSAGAAFAGEEGVKQPIFLVCPHNKGESAWSLFFMVDDSDHSQILSLGLEKLIKQNSKDSSYLLVMAAQHDPQVKSELITKLDAKDFATLQLDVKKDDALHVSLARRKDGSMELIFSMRVGASDRFVIGGKEGLGKRELVVHYDPITTLWLVRAKILLDYMGVKIPSAPGRAMSGLVFKVTDTGIYMVVGVWENGDGAILMDRSEVVTQ